MFSSALFLVQALCLHVSQGFLAHFDICDELMYVNCQTEAKNTRVYRDSYGNYYENFCLYSQAKCRDAKMDLDAVCTCQQPNLLSNNSTTMQPNTVQAAQTTGNPTMPQTAAATTPITTSTTTTNTPTTTNTATTTTVPAATTSGGGSLLSVFCQNKDFITCPTDKSSVCGSDNVTYDNQCLLAKAQCLDSSLIVLKEGKC